MKLIFLILGFFLMISVCDLKLISADRLDGKNLKDVALTTVEIIKKYGYPAETHKTETEDGYFLTLFRIPHGKNSTKIGFPILAAHGLVADSSEFLLYGEKSLGFFLADEGYDVWLANMRGTPYSKRHKFLSHRSPRFWDFSWHEYGVYDLPASIDYICNHTRNRDVLLLGFSMGATASFVMTSERPEYGKKVRGGIMLAPVTTLKYSTSPAKLLAPFVSISQGFSKIFLKGQYDVHNPAFRKFVKVACNTTLAQFHMCTTAVFLIAGNDNEGFDKAGLLNFLIQGQSSTSTKTIVHYAQLMVSGKFRQYDYGLLKNMRKYKQRTPPKYALEAITTPMCLFAAPNDAFATRRDIELTLMGKPFVKSIYHVPQDNFIHLDFITGKDAKELVYCEMLDKIKYLINLGGSKSELECEKHSQQS